MKKILIIALTLIAFTTANAQTPAAKETATTTVNAAQATETAPVAAPATEEQTPAAPTAGSGPNVSANYVGTNDLNLLLLRQGVKRA